MKLVTVIDDLRIRKGWTRRQLANYAGISMKRINDGKLLTGRDVCILAMIFNVQVEFLFSLK